MCAGFCDFRATNPKSTAHHCTTAISFDGFARQICSDAVLFRGKGGKMKNSRSAFFIALQLKGTLPLTAGPGRFAIGRFLPLPKSAQTGRPIVVLE